MQENGSMALWASNVEPEQDTKILAIAFPNRVMLEKLNASKEYTFDSGPW